MSSIKWLLIVMAIASGASAFGQQTIFTVMQDPVKLADSHFDKGEYYAAIELYKNALRRHPEEAQLHLKLAHCYEATRDFASCVDSYRKYSSSMPTGDLIRYGDALLIMQDYKSAEECYKKAIQADPANDVVSKKVWRLRNLQFLYEDSAHFSLQPIKGINTHAAEFGPVPFKHGLVFTSNRKELRPMDHVNKTLTSQYFSTYYVPWKTDTTLHRDVPGQAQKFASSLHEKHNMGPLAFFQNGSRMVFVASSEEAREDGYRSMGLHFATLDNNKWKVSEDFAYNSLAYSINDVTINEEGTLIYFSSNMDGGIGGTDIYQSKLVDGKWSKPLNLGEPVNTAGDESFPYLHKNSTLYFSSNGHPGLGALDIFRASLISDGFSEPDNVGYPLNSHLDDFGLILDSVSTHGYISSNRLRGHFDDDLFEFDMDLQTYPVMVSGVLKFKPFNWSTADDIKPGPNVKLVVVDSWRNKTVFETTTGADGSFTVSIPYFSRYHLLVTDDAGNTHLASLEIAKYRADASAYEVVVVKDLFAEQGQRK